MKKREGQPNFDFDKEPEPPSLKDTPEWKKTKEKIHQASVLAKGEHETFEKVYSLLSDHEREELKKITDPSERRAYVVRKYSKLLGPID